MSMIKYRVHEVAKDFGLPTKTVTQILTDYIAPPKNHMQVLETNELDVIFEYITQHNQVESLEEIFKVEPKAAPKQEEKKPETVSPAKEAAAPAKGASTAAPQHKAPAPEAPKAEKKDKPHIPRQVAEKRVVDTRGGAAVNIEKYNESLKTLPARAAETISRAAAAKRKRSAIRTSSARTRRSPRQNAARKSATRCSACSLRSRKSSS